MHTIGNSYSLTPISDIPDNDKPLSFQVWKNSYEIILPDQEYILYNDYLLNWYKNKSTKKEDTALQIKINFLNLLKQIQVFFTEEEKESWYSGIDIDNEKEVLLAIPYFARKLKNISLYYLQLREQIKRSKIKYNLAGSNKSVVKQIQNTILQNYTKKEDKAITLPSSLWANIPQLSSIKNNIVIEIEELYDTSSYYDRSINLPPSAYFTIDSETEKYFSTKGIFLSGIDWVYRLGTFTVSALSDPRLQGTTGTELCSLYFDLALKYLGSDFFSTLIVDSSSKQDFYTINIQPGNNFFNYPAGPYKLNVTGLPRYKPVPLSATALQTFATPGSSLEQADTIFVKTKKGIEGAWFRQNVLDIAPLNMKATIEGSTSTIFRFPYPGYGISAEDIQWTGYSTVTDPRFFYLDENTKKIIENVYWGSSFALSGVVPLPINSTSLINNGAYPSTDFESADKIRVWPTPPQFNSTSYSGTVNEAWLYKFLKTNISIGNNKDNTIVWPFYKIPDPINESLPELPTGICLPESLSSLNLPFATGSGHLSSADVVYKINNYQDKKTDAIECAWLSAENYEYADAKTYGSKQPYFSAIFYPGTFTYFIWDYNDKTNINDIIPGTLLHTPDCKFINTPNTTYRDHKLCTCKQVNFAPFGHPGDNFYDNVGLADFIIEDVGYIPESVVNVSNWRDRDNKNFIDSPAACWFKTNDKIGWGNGRWRSGDPTTDNSFYLQRGKRYIYYRANIRDQSIATNSLPELVVRKEMSINSQTKRTWITATKDRFGRWYSTGVPSQMVLNPNDLLIYDRIGTTNFNITGTYLEPQQLSERRVSIWSTFDYITVNNPTARVSISYPSFYGETLPIESANENDFYKQYPKASINSINRIFLWTLTDPNNVITSYYNTPNINFIPSLTGLYTVAVTAITSTPVFSPNNQTIISNITGCYYFSNIPPITCVPNVTEMPSVSTYTTPIPGFVLETNLRGWSYTTNTKTVLSINLTGEEVGATPVWMRSNINKTFLTDYKAVESWGPSLSFVDTYNPIIQPTVSNIVLRGGEYIEYKRKPQFRIVWNQDITINNKPSSNKWCKLEFTKNSNPTNINPVNNLISKPTTEPSTIVLQNVVENDTVEVYYNALNAFVWNITAEPQIPEIVYFPPISSAAITSNEPWSNLTNQFNPTVAFLPAFDTLYNNKELGDYFKPSNLGLLTYVNKDYEFDLSLSSFKTTDIYGSPSKKIKNRGLTKENQFSPYNITKENNIWLKEPYTTGSLAGTIKKDIFKRYQKFIPYQSTYESNPQTRFGLITPVSRQHPWGGPQNTDWADSTNQPISFTGEINVSHWAKDQVLKNTTLYLDNWCSDVFGNQYGLYKNIKNTTPSQRSSIPGQIWIRKNSQQTEPGYNALLEVFDTYKNLSLYNELTGSGIYKLDSFYDTLLFETSGAIIFEKINYDYSQSGVFSIADSARAISLAMPITNNLNREFTNTLPIPTQYGKSGDTWFFAKEKLILISTIELENYSIVPKIYSLNLNKNILKLAFTISSTEQVFNSLSAIEVSRPILSYNSSNKQLLYTFTTKDSNNKDSIIAIHINNDTELVLKDIKIYTSQLTETLPPTILSNLTLTLPQSSTYSQQIVVEPSNSTFEVINFPAWANLTPTGFFTCLTPNIQQNFNLQFKVTNDFGPVYSSLNINIQ